VPAAAGPARDRAPRRLESRERLRLPPRPIEREHQLVEQSLSQRVPAYERLQLGYEVTCASEREIRHGTVLEGPQALLFEPRRFGGRKWFVDQVGQSGAAPERERRAERRRRLGGLAAGQLLTSLLAEPLEADEIELAGLDLQPIAGRTSRESPVSEQFSQA
jgi:hypothetical protein